MLDSTQIEISNERTYDASYSDAELDSVLASLDTIAQEEKPNPVSTLDLAPVFDYATISEATVRKQAQDAAARIRAKLDKAKVTFLEIGRDLLSIKEQLAHGEFSQWLEAEFDMTIRTAQNMMSAAELANKYEAISILPPTIIYKLAAKSTPDDVQTKIVSQIQNGIIPSAKDIEAQISQAKEIRQRQKKFNVEQKAAERAAHIDELSWQKNEKALKDANIPDADIAKERKKWMTANAKKERNKQRLLEAEEKRMEEARLKHTKCEEHVILVVKFLHEKLGTDFDEFRSIFAKLENITLFERALKIL